MNTTNPMDDLPDTIDPRQDPRLNDTAFLATDEGQKLLEDVAKADAEQRRLTKQAEMKAKAEAAAKRKAEIDASHKPGPVEVVKPATNGKPSKAAAKATPKARSHKVDPAVDVSTTASVERHDIPARGRPKNVTPITAAKSARAKATTPAKPGKVTNRPIVLGTKPIDVDGVKQFPILGKDGKPQERYQKDNWIWRCSECGWRVRTAECKGEKAGTAHAAVAAPAGYRRESRLAK